VEDSQTTPKETVRVLSALSDENRFRIVSLLAHEDAVLSLLAGETHEGRDELDILRSEFGPIDDVELIGTVVEGELRTYVTIASGSESITLWYALDDHGGIEAVEGPAEPVARFVLAGDGRFRRDDPTGADPGPAVEFHDDGMTVAGAGETVSARLAD
jgi:hypothetical protein